MNFIVFAITYPFIWILSRLPMRILYIISDFFFFLMFYIIGYRKKVVLDNLKLSFPNKTEEELKAAGVEIKVGSFPMKALGRSRASMDIQGLIKIIADKNTDEILGVHMIGARAADLIMEGVVAMEFRASAEDIARISHPHPTYSEAVKEAAMAATEDRAMHI